MAGWWAYRARRRAVGPLAGSALLLTALLTSCALGPAGLPAVLGAMGPFGQLEAVRVLQMNLCNSGAAGCYTGRSVAEAVAVIRAAAPDVVTLNEVCADDVPVLADALGGTGSTDVASAFQAAGDRRTGAALRCRNGRPYGIGLIVRRTRWSPGYDTRSGFYPVQDRRSPEQRAWLCLLPSAGSVLRTGPVVCTTHLANDNAAVASAQCAYLLGTALPAVRARRGPLVLGGDLNLTAGGSPGVRSCLPAADRGVDDGAVQHVVATTDFVVAAHRTIDLTATDHPGLLVTLTLGPAALAASGDLSR